MAGSGVNLYGYAGDNPVTYADPTGLAAVKDWASLVGPGLGILAFIAGFFSLVFAPEAAILAIFLATVALIAGLVAAYSHVG